VILYNNKLNSPSLGFLSSPFFTHDASCVVLNIDWTPLLQFKSPTAVETVGRVWHLIVVNARKSVEVTAFMVGRTCVLVLHMLNY